MRVLSTYVEKHRLSPAKHFDLILSIKFHIQILAKDTCCKNDVILTAMQRDYVASTSIRRHFVTKCPLGCLLPYTLLVLCMAKTARMTFILCIANCLRSTVYCPLCNVYCLLNALQNPCARTWGKAVCIGACFCICTHTMFPHAVRSKQKTVCINHYAVDSEQMPLYRKK